MQWIKMNGKADADWLAEIEELQREVEKWKGYFHDEQERRWKADHRAEKHYCRMLAAYTVLLWTMILQEHK